MFVSDQYQLLDFGAGRKLERFGACVTDRPSPAAASAERRGGDAWARADARYERVQGARGRWSFERDVAAAWPIQFGPMTLELKFTDSGQVGLFPEQAGNWEWIADQVRAAGRPLRVLNLFAYTGGSTLAAAIAGAHVTHVDSATNVVAWARRNAAASHLENAPIRWIVDDAVKFARRELKRGRRYDAVMLDPPSYGHGPRGEAWTLGERLGELLEVCWALTVGTRAFLLLTCHSGALGSGNVLREAAISHAPDLAREGKLEAGDMALTSSAGARLHAGASVRWSAGAATTDAYPGVWKGPVTS